MWLICNKYITWGYPMDKKIPLKVVTTFSGIGFQEMGIRNTGLFDMEVVNTCELDTDAIISYAAIHHGLTRKMVENYLFYPDRYTMALELKRKNIGFDFLANKPYDWLGLVTSVDNNMVLETAWLADHLNKNVGDISRVKEFPYCDLLTFSFPCFTGDTKVQTSDGLKRIDSIKVGDIVNVKGISYEVTCTSMNGYKVVGDLKFNDGYVVSCTPNHLFLEETPNGRECWSEAQDLPKHTQSRVVAQDGYRFVESYGNFRYELVYDISVQTAQRFALENGAICHNCTDLSLAGRQAGMVKGETRSGLVYEVIRILQNMKELNVLPPFLLMENVDALVNKKNLPQFELLNEEFAELGYDCKWDVINGKNCGVPQNRKRVFAIYWLRDKYDLSTFEFPKPYDTGIRLKDVLQKDVDEKYYITNERATALIRNLVAEGKVKVDLTKKSDE